MYGGGVLNGILANGVFVAIGNCSMEFYLLHMPVLDLLKRIAPDIDGIILTIISFTGTLGSAYIIKSIYTNFTKKYTYNK